MNHFLSKPILSLFFSTVFLQFSQTNHLIGKCVGVADGDTITILDNQNQEQKVRLAHIDCPEKKQPFSHEAKVYTSEFCFGKMVYVVPTGKKDRNGRIIGVVFNDQGQELNAGLVQAGLAWHYKKYSDDIRYDSWEQEAKRKRIGIWTQPTPIEPWNWRKMKKNGNKP